MAMPEYRECPIENMLILSSLYTFSKRRFADNYSFKGETHDFTEVVCVTDGKAGITADKNIYVLSAGQMIIHRPNEFHAIWSDCGTSPETVIFSFKAERFPELSENIYTLSPERISELKGLFYAAEKTFIIENNNVLRCREGMETEASMLLKRLEIFLLNIFTTAREGKSDGRDAVFSEYFGKSAENYKRILSIMESRLDRALSTEELAKICNMSVPSLEKTMQKYSGCGAMNYFSALKMKRAAELLSEGKSVKETALSLGFSNQNYFSERFKKHFGYPPSHRKQF